MISKKIKPMRKRRHSGMEAGIQRPRMANLEPPHRLNQAFAQLASNRPWHWIPAIHAGMTAIRIWLGLRDSMLNRFFYFIFPWHLAAFV
jgi:hypothetical protein